MLWARDVKTTAPRLILCIVRVTDSCGLFPGRANLAPTSPKPAALTPISHALSCKCGDQARMLVSNETTALAGRQTYLIMHLHWGL